MWIFTTTGYFSVTRSRQEPDKIQLRCRSLEHLTKLVARYQLQNTTIATPDSDYLYRVILTQGEWVALAARMAADIDYSNFKSAAHQDAGSDHKFVSVLHRIWSITADAFGCGFYKRRNHHPAPAYDRQHELDKIDQALQELDSVPEGGNYEPVSNAALKPLQRRNLSKWQREVLDMLREGAKLGVDEQGRAFIVYEDNDPRTYVADRNVERLVQCGFITEVRDVDGHRFDLVDKNNGKEQ